MSVRSVVTGIAGAVASGILTMYAGSPLLAQDASPVLVEGKGTAQLSGELVSWQDALYGANQQVDVSYFSRGADEGRSDLLRGKVDFAVSGIPFSEGELADKPADAGELISAPISMAALAVVFNSPVSGVGAWSTQHADQACLDEWQGQYDEWLFNGGPDPAYDPETCYTRGTFEGPFRVPPANLAALMLGINPSFQSNRLAAWSDPGWAEAIGTADLKIAALPNAHHTWVNRTEGSAANRYLMEYAKTMAPDVWEMATTVWQPDDPADPYDYVWDPVQSRFSSRSASRFGNDTMMGLLAISDLDVQTGTYHEGFTGNAGAIPSTLVKPYFEQNPKAGFRLMEIQNANGDWVLPTTESIGLAAAAGDAPNIAATEPVPGAYPLTWVERLYTFGGTLDPEQANALAAAVRYIATDGQAAVVAHDGAALPPRLVDEALAAADQIVAANCPADTHEVAVGGPGPMEPGTPGVQTLTDVAHCVVLPPTTTTTSTTTTSTTTTTPVAELPPPESVSTTTTTTSSTSTTTTTAAPAVTTTTAPPYVPPPNQPSSGSSGPRTTVPSPAPTTTLAPVAAPPTTAPPATSAPPASTEPPVATEPPASSVPPATEPEGLRLGRGLDALPMGLPTDGATDFEKLGTFGLGAALFLAVRSFVQRQRSIT